MSEHHENALKFLRQDELLAPIVAKMEITPPQPSYDVYADLIESIVSQQLSVKAAATIYKRFLTKIPSGYPSPEEVLALSMEEMRAVGLSGQKSQYIKNVAEYAQSVNLLELDWDTHTDQEIVEMLSSIKGVGVWTVQMVLMFTLNRPDVFPAADLGIQQAMARLFGLEMRSKTFKKEIEMHSERWKPYRTYVSKVLWRWKDTK
jgi:DNA-3-methyladenine glycosylase II